ncbi:MAG: acyl-CoA synthetase [Burkholderiales bacterium]
MRAGWLALPERGSRAAVGLMTRLTLALGRSATRCLLYPICLYFYAFSPRTRRASRAYLMRVLDRAPGASDVLRHFHTFAATLHDRLFFVQGRLDPFEVNVHGEGEVDRLLGRGNGCLLLGSHLGSFEVLRALGRFGKDYRINVVMHEAGDTNTGRALATLAPPAFKQEVIHPGDPDAILRVKECLDRGEIVGILGDRAFGDGRTWPCRFLGATAQFPLGPWLLAATLGVPVVLFFGLYRGGPRYDVFFETVTEGASLLRAERLAMAERWVEQYVVRLEHYCRQAPYNWFNFYEFWDERVR